MNKEQIIKLLEIGENQEVEFKENERYGNYKERRK